MDQRLEKRMINVIIANHLNKQNAVWVQSGNDFVDLLYSFLTMPLGTIVRLLDNHGSCGNMMNKEIPSPEGEMLRDCYDYDGVFVHGDGKFAFILSDDLKIDNFCWDFFRKKIKNLGCVDLYDEAAEGEAEIGFREAVTLLRSLFTSETPLTTTFFPFQSSSHPFTIAFKPSISPCDLVLGQNQPSFYHEHRLKHVIAIDPKTECGQPRSSDLTMRELDDLKISFNDVTIEQITIGRAEAISLFKASFATSSALTNGLSDLLAKKLEGF
ncbi:unnamed protein product [Brassica rapa subsp. trilocularis]